MKDFLETYAHAIRAAVAIVVIGFLFYLGSTMNPEEEFIAPEPTIEVKIEPIAEPEPVVEAEPVTEVVDEIIEPEATPEPETIIEMVEVEAETEVDTIEVTVEAEIDTTVEDSSLFTDPWESRPDSVTHIDDLSLLGDITLSEDGYLIVPDSVDNIVNAFVYAAERVGRNTYFVWRDSTFTTENFYANTKSMNN